LLYASRTAEPLICCSTSSPFAMVVPVQNWQAAQGKQVALGGILALRGTGRGLWPQGVAKAVAQLRNEWQDSNHD